MPKMKTLMSDEDTTPGLAGPNLGEPAGARPGELEPKDDLLRELARPCVEPVVLTDTTAPYIGFASSRSGTWEPLRQLHPKIQEGTPFIGMSDGQFDLADPLQFHLVNYKQFWSLRDDQYYIKSVQFGDPGRRSGLSEEFLAVTVVHLGRRLVPTVSYFGGTKAGAVRKAAEALRMACSADWAGLGPVHAASSQFPLPFGRSVTAVTMEPRTSRETGRQYQLAVGHVRPATLEELDVLTKAVQDADFLGRLRIAIEVYGVRLRTLEEIAQGGAVA